MASPLFDLPPDGPKPRKTEAQEQRDVVQDIMYGLVAPLISYPGWEDLLRDHKDRIILQRLAHGLEIAETKQATEFEAKLYLSTASLAVPMTHRWAEIFFHLFHKQFPDQPAVKEIRNPELDQQQQQELAYLRNWIYRTQINHMKAKARGETPEIKKEQKQLEEEQAKLFR